MLKSCFEVNYQNEKIEKSVIKKMIFLTKTEPFFGGAKKLLSNFNRKNYEVRKTKEKS
jgi:hypothetical protein